MKIMSKALTKSAIATVAAGAVALTSAAPAVARDQRNNDSISAGEIIAGALVIGGIAAVASAASRNDRGYDYRYDRAGYDDRGYDRGNGYGQDARANPRRAIEQCVRTAESQAGRYSYGRADVTDIREVKQTRYGLEVRGRIAVNSSGRGWRNGDDRYGRGWGGDYRGWNDNLRGYDSGSFKCRFERGRVVDLDYSGLRGL